MRRNSSDNSLPTPRSSRRDAPRHETEERFARLIDVATDGYWDHDLRTGTLHRSARLADLIGPAGDERFPPERPLGDSVHPDDRDRVETAFRALIAGTRPLDIELRVHTRWGSYRWIRARGHVVRGESGAPDRLAGIVQDTSALRRAMGDLKSLLDSVRRARDQAEAANRAKSDFLATVSHEIRTPLNGILGMVRLLRSTEMTQEQRHYAGCLHRSGTALLTLINDLLDLSKLEAGRLQLDLGEFRPNGLVDGIIDVVAPIAQEKGIELSAAIDPSLPQVMIGDARRLRQVLTNLAGNAVKFTAAGSVRIAVGPAKRNGYLVTVRFAVSDTGIGIAEDQQGRLFNRFSQGDSATARKYGGTGLGLAISKQLVELMEGQIGFESEPGRGSTFWFEVPLVDGEASRRTAEPPPAVLPAATGRPLRLLLAEDNPVNRDYMATLLRSAGHVVDLVVDGGSAVAAVRKGDYDVVMMDVRMPGLDGVAATAAIRALPEPACRVPVIALTANALGSEHQRYRDAGMSDYVTKPVNVRALAAAMGRSIGRPVALPDFDAPRAATALAPDAESAVAEFLSGLDRLDGSGDRNG